MLNFPLYAIVYYEKKTKEPEKKENAVQEKEKQGFSAAR